MPKNSWTGIRFTWKVYWAHLTYSKLTYFNKAKQKMNSILNKLTYLEGYPRRFRISWYCKLDRGMDEPNIHSELEMQQMLQVDLLVRPANFTSPLQTRHGAPSQVNNIAKRIQLISPPRIFTRQQAKN